MPLVKLVDTKDLKSLPLAEWQFELAEGTIMLKPYVTFDKSKNSIKNFNFLKKNLNLYSIKNSNLIIVVGGDGYMLTTLKI